MLVLTAGIEPATFRVSDGRSATELCEGMELLAGIEPAARPYQGRVLPLNYRSVTWSPRPGIEPATYRLQSGCSATELRGREMERTTGLEPAISSLEG